jgi:dihydropteroate synthase
VSYCTFLLNWQKTGKILVFQGFHRLPGLICSNNIKRFSKKTDMTFTVVTKNFKESFDRWVDALETANQLRPKLKSWFVDIRIFDGDDLVWMYSKLRAFPEYIGPGTYDRLARQFVLESQAQADQAQQLSEQMGYQSGELKPQPWQIRQSQFLWGTRTYLMGVLNVTPDSFSDGGQFNSVSAAVAQAEQLVASGMDILDIGGQSARPGAAPVTLSEELNRVIPVLEAIRAHSNPALAQIPISIDTTRAAVARAALDAGADIVNDISGGTYEPDIFQVAADKQVPIILMHLRGTPATMQQMTDYEDLIAEICQFLQTQMQQAMAAGILRERIVLDPGIGFAKKYEQNLTILRELAQFKGAGCPLLVGVSRKSFIGWILQPENPQACPPQERIWGTAAACTSAIAQGADILRVHDGAQMREVAQVADAIYRKMAL